MRHKQGATPAKERKMKLFYETKMYDYETKQKAQKHIETMKKKGWRVKEQYEQDETDYKWTVVYHRGAV